MLLTVCLLFLPSAASAVDIVWESTQLELSTDKACYAPGNTVTFTAVGTIPEGKTLFVRYRHGNDIIENKAFVFEQGNTWTWKTPNNDFVGYLVDIHYVEDTKEHILGTIAVDVSSDWKRFPRYGFVADFNDYNKSIDKYANIEAEMKYLNRLHINGVQFQDWHWKHHKPVKFREGGSLDPWYQDISNRWIGTEYVKKYIEVQHRYGMKSIFYNLCYGAWKDYEADDVSPEWGLYKKDANGKWYQDFHGLPSDWQSDILLMNPGNRYWQDYLKVRNDEVYKNYNFDGYQVDQIGGRGDVFEKNGTKIDLQLNYGYFLKAMKDYHKDKRLVMNSVGGYGTHHICDAKLNDGTRTVDFCYNEVWGEQPNFESLFEIIKSNDKESDHKLQTVFAAYINYDKADHAWDWDEKERNVNTPGALLTDAVMFAIGGSHLEMGDHMLTREYFPAKPLGMTKELRERLVHYYDFMTGYQNLLRGIDSKGVFQPSVSSTSHSVNAWPPKSYHITAFAKNVERNQVVHLLNFYNTNDLSWRDLKGTRPAPDKLTNINFTFETIRQIRKVWTATPDNYGGAPLELPFTQDGNKVTVTVPSLEYWTMVVFETAAVEDNMYVTGEDFNDYKAEGMVEMTKGADGNTYNAKLTLKKGKKFKFVNGKDFSTNSSYYAEFNPYEFKDGYNTANLLVSKSNMPYTDYQFTVDTDGDYYVTLNLKDMRITVNKVSAVGDYANLYVIGDATTAGWTISNGIQLARTGSNIEYTGNCVITGGNGKSFKFLTNNTAGWDQVQFVKGATDNDIVKKTEDNKWFFTKEQTANYKITVNLNSKRVTFTKLDSKVFLCDGPFTNKWDSYSTQMRHLVADDIFYYTFKKNGKAERIFLRFNISQGNFSDTFAPKGTTNVQLTNGIDVPVPVTTEGAVPRTPTGKIANSWYFDAKANTTYTIAVKGVNSGGYFEKNSEYNPVGLRISYYEEPTPNFTLDADKLPQLSSTTHARFNGASFVQCGGKYWFKDIDLTGNTSEFRFKIYDSGREEFIGGTDHQARNIKSFSFRDIYYGSNELGPDYDFEEGRNLDFIIPASMANKKIRINLWQESENGGLRTWKFYIEDIGGVAEDACWFVANGKRYPMSCVKQRVGDRSDIRTIWSVSFQDFQLEKMSGGKFNYYIEGASGKRYACHSINAGYQLGFNVDHDFFPNGDYPNSNDSFEKDYAPDAGNVARYERYDNMEENGSGQFSFDIDKMKAKGGRSVTWNFNYERGKTITILVNKTNFGTSEDPNGYSLVGNLCASDKGTESFEMKLENENYSRKMKKLWYNNGKEYTTSIANPDSVVYRVTVNKPDDGWKPGGYTFVVFDNATMDLAKTATNVKALWKNAIRPQEEWFYHYDEEGSNYTGVNATALHGGLYTRRKDANEKHDVQQMIAFTPKGDSFTFSLNTTTSTYSITDNALFIMGPAVGTTDADRETAGWNSDQPDTQTAHAYRLTYDSTLRCYCYKGADGKGEEQPVPMAANKLFAFAYNKQFNNLFFSEDGDVPLALIDAEGKSTEATAYAAVTGTNGKYDTQYVNWLQPHDSGADTYDPSVVNACRFSLPTNTDGGYYIRLYTKPGDTDTSLPKSAYYTIRRAYTFSTPIDPKNPVRDYNTFKTFSDYHAVVIPTGIEALYVSSANKVTRTITATKYPLYEIEGKRVLPAGAAVILVESKSVAGTPGTIEKSTELLDYHSDPTFAEANYGRKPAMNMLKPQITRTILPYNDGNYYNYLFAFQKRWDSDEKKTIGFFKAGVVNNPVNTAYLQIGKDFNDAAAKGWSLSFDFNDATGIRQPEIVDGGGDCDCYTLQGIRVKKPAAKGIYIVNGKKVIR